MSDTAQEVARLRAEVELLTRGLRVQVRTLELMNVKLDRLLELASTPADGSLSDLLRELIEQNAATADALRNIIRRLPSALPEHVGVILELEKEILRLLHARPPC